MILQRKLPMVSIIIPAYNVAPFLGELLDDIKKQTFQDYELIIVNDGSTDDTQSVIDRAAEQFGEKLLPLREENKGQSAARNLAMRNASGEYIAFLDSDDRIAGNYLEALLAAAKAQDADMAKCSYNDFSTDSGKEWLAYDIRSHVFPFPKGKEFVYHYCVWAGLFRRDFLQKNGFSFSEGEQMEDSPYGLLTCLFAEKVACVEEPLYRHRVRESGSTMAEVAKAKKSPKVPYNGMKDAAEKITQNLQGERLKLAEYLYASVLASFLTTMYVNHGREVRHAIAKFSEDMVNKYFPNLRQNPYVLGKEKLRLPLAQRVAVKLFVFACSRHSTARFSDEAVFLLKKLQRK